MNTIEIRNVLEFLRLVERLKDTLRTSRTSSGRQESVAEHTWRLCLMFSLFRNEFPEIDFDRAIRMCIVHDMGEIVAGDIPATFQKHGDSKSHQERQDLESILVSLPAILRGEILELWDEYEAAATPEAKLVKAFDKLETIIQHNQGMNAPDFDYEFNLTYGSKFTTGHPLLAEIREILDQETKRLSNAAKRLS